MIICQEFLSSCAKRCSFSDRVDICSDKQTWKLEYAPWHELGMCCYAYWSTKGTGLGALFHSYWILAQWEWNYSNDERKNTWTILIHVENMTQILTATANHCQESWIWNGINYWKKKRYWRYFIFTSQKKKKKTSSAGAYKFNFPWESKSLNRNKPYLF